MIVELSPAQAIAAASGIVEYHKRMVKHYRKKGVPSFAAAMTCAHVEEQESAHAALLIALRAEGYVMLDKDLIPLDFSTIEVTP